MEPMPENFEYAEMVAMGPGASGGVVSKYSRDEFMSHACEASVAAYVMNGPEMLQTEGHKGTRSLLESGYVDYFAKVYDLNGGCIWYTYREGYAIEEPEGYFDLTGLGLGADRRLCGTFEFFSAYWMFCVIGRFSILLIVTLSICLCSAAVFLFMVKYRK